jgi:hypothetical protein
MSDHSQKPVYKFTARLGSLQTNGELDQKKISNKLKRGIGQNAWVAGVSTLDPVNADMEWCSSDLILFQWSLS